jgi:aryl-alcohol dehydrogenase-like predicted oxidoreductase
MTTFTPAGTTLALKRVGFGAMQIPGPMVWGTPRDRDAALAVVREAVRIGINHIDTSDYYGPHVANEIIREAIYPYASDLTIVTKVGARREADKSWLPAISPKELTSAVHDNLRNLRLEALDIVNLRLGSAFGPNEDSVAEPLSVLIDLQSQGLIKHIGLSNISQQQFEEGRAMAKIVCVQNHYNVGFRRDDAFVGELAALGIAYVPYFPLGGFRPLTSTILDAVALDLGAMPRQVALAWLLARSPNILVIAGTSSVEHLRENVKAATLKLPAASIAQLDEIAAAFGSVSGPP